jgi:photosystem II stability/assembly factor-like uncharacterized protein
MKTLIMVIFILYSSTSFAQIYENWVLRYNGTGNSLDEAAAVASDQTGNVYVTGYSINSSGNLDYVTQKYNPCGNIRWSNSYNYGDDFANDLGIDLSGNVYVTGDFGGNFANYIWGTVKYNSDGVFQWESQLFGPVYLSNNGARKMFVDGSGNVYITGTTSQNNNYNKWDVMTAKYNSAGQWQWKKYYDGPGNDDDIPEDIFVDSQGNSYVAGGSIGNGTDYDYFILKYSAGGTLLGIARYNGEANGSDGAYSIAVDELGNIYVTGQSEEYENPQENSTGQITFTTIKYNNNLVLLWYDRYFGTGIPRNARGKSIKLLNSNEIYVSGYAKELGVDNDFVTRKLSSTGNQTWVAKYNGPGVYEDVMTSFTIDNSGNAYVTGESKTNYPDASKDYATLKYNSSGVQQWVKRYNGPANDQDIPSSISHSGNNVIYVTGKSKGINSDFDYATIKYSNQWSSCEVEDNMSENFNDIYILNKDTAFLVGNNGKIMSSFDKGKQWNILNSGVNCDLLRVKFLNSNLGITLGDSVLLKTTNGGLNWNQLQSSSVKLNDAFILNNRTSLIPSSNGKILKSNDLWNSYSVQNTNLAENIIKVHFSDSLNGKCISETGKVLKTVNGGTTWSSLSNLNIGRINNAFFKNSNVIIVVGDNGKIMVTSNAGVNWYNRNINNNVRLSSVYLDIENKLYVGGDDGLILFSSNYGLSWEEQPTNVTARINDIGFFDNNSGIALTEDGQVLLTSLGTIELGIENFTIPLEMESDVKNGENLSHELFQNFPNPFNPVTQIKFTIPENNFVVLKVYDVLGKEIKTLVTENLKKGNHSVNFDGSNLPSGIYFYRIFSGNFIQQLKMLLIK